MLRLLAIGALCQLGLACYGSRMDGPAESRDAGPPASDGGAPDARAPDAHTRSACDDWCASRRVEEESGGWCALERWSEGAASGCAEACASRLERAPADAVRACVEGDPLCFISTEDCIEGQLRRARRASWCAARVARGGEGFCAPALEGLPERECEPVCLRALHEGLEGVERCLLEDPLCFRDLSACAEAEG